MAQAKKKELRTLFHEILLGSRLSQFFKQEHRFHPTRKWRFDYADEQNLIAVEVEGGAWIRGRHTRGAGYIGDCDKYNTAQLLGWKILRIASVAQARSFPTLYSELRCSLKLALAVLSVRLLTH